MTNPLGCRVLFFLIIFFSHFPFNSVLAQFPAEDPGMIGKWWHYSLKATSKNYPTLLTVTNYDDWRFPQTGGPSPSPIYWNCQRSFLYTGYTAPDDSVDYEISLNSSPTYTDFDVYITHAAPGITEHTVATFLNKHFATPFRFGAAAQGLYTIYVFPHGADPATDPYLLKEFQPLIPKIRKLWIEATPLCSGSYTPGTYYSFQVRSEPDISTIINRPIALGLMTYPPVASWPAPYSDINCASFDAWDIRMEAIIEDVDLYSADIKNLSTSETHYFNLNDRLSTDVTNYSIDYFQLNNWLSPSGGRYGKLPYIKVHYDDRIATQYDLSMPLIIKSPPSVIASSNPTAVPPTDFPGPPHAVGIPNSSYDLYDYVVVGNETWLPSNNPFTVMKGGGTINTVRIQNKIKIPAGAQLTISGMRLEFGPNAKIDVLAATSPSGIGGTVNIVEGSVLTAYRGCTNTESSTWAGIVLNGNWSYPIPLSGSGTGLDFWGMPHGKLNIRNSTISYADEAVKSIWGGGVLAYNTNFVNNKTMMKAGPYHNIIGGIEYNSVLSLTNCKMTVDNEKWFGVSPFIILNGNKGFSASNCEFKNLGISTVWNCIEGYDAGMTLESNYFFNFGSAVSASSISGTRSLKAIGNTFDKNLRGLEATACIAPYVTGNYFNIPPSPATTPSLYYGTGVLMIDAQNIGVYMRSSTGYNISNNTFRRYGHSIISSALPSNYITGTLEYSTGSDPNQVIKNDFAGLGVAMLSNFINRNTTGLSGLRYLCNTDKNVLYDISALGNNSVDGGINVVQATKIGSNWASAGNKLAGNWNLYNQQKSFAYHYKEVEENPVVNVGSVVPTYTVNPANCVLPATSGSGPYSKYMTVGVSTLTNYIRSQSTDAYLNYAMATTNLNYYLTKDVDTLSDPRRDSIYYWASEMNTAYGDLLLSNLLIEDSLIDSAINVYDGIISKYSLDTLERNEFLQGRTLIDLLISKRSSGWDISSLSASEIASLENLRNNTRMWAQARAKAWLKMVRGDAFSDTLLFPDVTDSANQVVHPKGVLALTEFSQGNQSGCQYLEAIVANCGSNNATEVDISGWLINDNSGVFNVSSAEFPWGECEENVGISRGHYRLKNDNIWKNVPNGAMIVMYNSDNNCYNLPDTFTIDSNYVYWVPIGVGVGENHVERYDGLQNSTNCGYCADTGNTIYTAGDQWMNTIGLDSALDGIQLLCPGCSPEFSVQPSFYFGVGYHDSDAWHGQISMKATMKDCSGSRLKFVFTGSNASDLINHSQWLCVAADTIGVRPPTLGVISNSLLQNAISSTLNLACCGGSQQSKTTNRENSPELNRNENGQVKVYPVPAKNRVFFEYPLSNDATIKIYDITGRLIDSKDASDSVISSFDLSKYQSGIYLYQFITNRFIKSGKFIVGE